MLDNGFLVPKEFQAGLEAILASDKPVYGQQITVRSPLYPEVENTRIKYNIELRTYDNRRIVRPVK